MIGEILNNAAEIDEYIEIGQCAEPGTEQHRLSAMACRRKSAGYACTKYGL